MFRQIQIIPDSWGRKAAVYVLTSLPKGCGSILIHGDQTNIAIIVHF